MKKIVCSVPAILFMSAASLSLIALAGCGGSSGSSNNPTGTAAAKNIYALQHSENGDTEQDSVLVFSASATGSTTPTSTLTLPSNFLSVSVAVGPAGTIYVGGVNATLNDDNGGGQILEYPAGSSGSATASVTLNGSNDATGTFIYPLGLAVNSAGTLFVSSPDGTLEAFASGFTASSAPTQYLTWGEETNATTGHTNFDDAYGTIGVDTAGEVFYLDEAGGVNNDGAIYVFAAGATGATAPVRTIMGTTSGATTNDFSGLSNIAVDGAGDVYVTNYNFLDDPNDNPATNPGTSAANKKLQAMWPRSASRLTAHPHVADLTFEPTGIIEFAAGATGYATPTKRIGPAGAATNATNIVEPLALAVDANSNLYYADANGGYETNENVSVLLEVFSPSATGNVAPAASITSTNYTYWIDAPPSPSMALRFTSTGS